MSKVSVTLRIAIPDGADAGDFVQVYSDLGTGTIDTGKPLLPAPVALFPGRTVRFGGYGRAAYGRGVHGTGRTARPHNGGYGDQVYAQVPYGTAAPYMEVTVAVPAAFSKHKFAAELVDAEGNVQGDPMPELAQMVSAEDPPTLDSFDFTAHDVVNDTVSFTFAINTE